jgi:hypothetical protein
MCARWLLVLFVVIMMAQVMTITESFGATSPGTLIQLETSRPYYRMGVVM